MKQYIDKAAIAAEIEKRKKHNKEWLNWCIENRTSIIAVSQAIQEDKDIMSLIDTLEVEEIETPVIPKHSYFEQIYHCGSEPRWKIGDVLAAYEFYSDHEGEHVYGEVIGVRNDETCDDWIYTMKGNFGGYEDIYENMLISDEAYKKN
jgi:hypothetical protein